jgi:hypothetical protein
MTPSITQDAINIALGNFLTVILNVPTGNVIVGQVNRVAEPEGDFAVMWPLHRPRLGTNFDTPMDCKFTGSIAATTMTVTDIDSGVIKDNTTVFGVGVAANTKIIEQLTGTPNGIGTYSVSVSQTLASQVLSAGYISVATPTEVVMQVDVHGPNSDDNAQTIQALFRDPYGVRLFEGTGVSPLYADDPRQMPFINAAKQYEERYVVDVHLMVTPVLNTPQEFADSVSVTVNDALVTIEE